MQTLLINTAIVLGVGLGALALIAAGAFGMLYLAIGTKFK